MLLKLTKLSLWMIVILLVGLIAASMPAAAQTAQQTITGCLQKGLETGGFFLISSDDQHWELYPGGSVSFADHVGQTVAVTGTSPTRTAAQEEKSQTYEKKETGTRKHADFQVTSLKVVNPTCGK